MPVPHPNTAQDLSAPSPQFLQIARLELLNDWIDCRSTVQSLRSVCRSLRQSMDPLFWRCLRFDVSKFVKHPSHCLVINTETSKLIQDLIVSNVDKVKLNLGQAENAATRIRSVIHDAGSLRSVYLCDLGWKHDLPLELRLRDGFKVDRIRNCLFGVNHELWDALATHCQAEPFEKVELNLPMYDSDSIIPKTAAVFDLDRIPYTRLMAISFEKSPTLDLVLCMVRQSPTTTSLCLRFGWRCFNVIRMPPTNLSPIEPVPGEIDSLNSAAFLDIKRLELHHHTLMNPTNLSEFLAFFPNINNLTFVTVVTSQATLFSDDHVISITRNCPNIDSIGVSLLTSVPPLAKLPHLKNLAVHFQNDPKEPQTSESHLRDLAWPDMPLDWRQDLETLTFHVDQEQDQFQWGVVETEFGWRGDPQVLKGFCNEHFASYSKLKWVRVKDERNSVIAVAFLVNGVVTRVEQRQLRASLDFDCVPMQQIVFV